MHQELSKAPEVTPLQALEEDEPPPWWQLVLRGQRRPTAELFGAHGIFSHFPIIAFGIIGALSVLPKNWPAATKLLAAATLLLSLLVFIGYAA